MRRIWIIWVMASRLAAGIALYAEDAFVLMNVQVRLV
ncbi:MAG: hypothetical protein RLY14_642 [Planctomycetota bacterium]|jgi:hypothetical protein